MKLLIDFTKMEYKQPLNNLDYFTRSFRLLLRDWIQSTPLNPPLQYRGFFKRFKKISYHSFGREIRFDNEILNKILVSHAKRLSLYDAISSIIYFILAFLLAILLILIWGVYSGNTEWGNLPLIFTLSLISAVSSARIAEFLVSRHFADSLVAVSGIYLFMELEKDVTLNDPYQRRKLLELCHYLERNLTLLATTFGGRGAENDRHYYHLFGEMKSFVQACERNIVASQEGTLVKLRKDFPAFLEILITGQYGRFEIEKEPDALTKIETEKPNRPLDNFLKLLVTTFPFVLLAVLFFLPEKVIALGIDSTIVLLVALAWILLVIDANLKLGIVERATSLMKTMKDLR
jgi:hypothetical protein